RAQSSRDVEWNKISTDFTHVGYREGITAGKKSALQEGFDAGVALVGALLGRDLGFLHGMASALVAYQGSASGACQHAALLAEARAIAAALGAVRLSDIVPRDLEAEEHARQHLADSEDADIMEMEMEGSEKLAEKLKMEILEDIFSQLTAGGTQADAENTRPTVEDVRVLEA
ncbi:hypothetical protein C8J57DRAFT_1059386, partial [Mycena rebaudengoi]